MLAASSRNFIRRGYSNVGRLVWRRHYCSAASVQPAIQNGKPQNSEPDDDMDVLLENLKAKVLKTNSETLTRLAEKERLLGQYKTEKEASITEIQKLKQEKQDLQVEMAEYTKKTTSIAAQHDAVLRDHTKHFQDYQAQIATLVVQRDNHMASAIKLQRQISALEATVKQLETVVNDLNKEKASLMDQIQSLASNHKDNLLKLTLDRDSMNNEKQNLAAKLEAATSEASEALKLAEQKVAEAVARADDSQRTSVRLSLELEKVKHEKASIDEERKQACQRDLDTKAYLSASQMELSVAYEEATSLREYISKIESQLMDEKCKARAVLDSAVTELSKRTEQLEDSSKEIEDLKAQVADTTQRLGVALEEAERHKDEDRGGWFGGGRKSKQYEKQIQDLQNKHNQEIKEKEDHLHELEAKVDELKAMLESRTDQREREQTGEKPGPKQPQELVNELARKEEALQGGLEKYKQALETHRAVIESHQQLISGQEMIVERWEQVVKDSVNGVDPSRKFYLTVGTDEKALQKVITTVGAMLKHQDSALCTLAKEAMAKNQYKCNIAWDSKYASLLQMYLKVGAIPTLVEGQDWSEVKRLFGSFNLPLRERQVVKIPANLITANTNTITPLEMCGLHWRLVVQYEEQVHFSVQLDEKNKLLGAPDEIEGTMAIDIKTENGDSRSAYAREYFSRNSDGFHSLLDESFFNMSEGFEIHVTITL